VALAAGTAEQDIHAKIRKARHALAIDDERAHSFRFCGTKNQLVPTKRCESSTSDGKLLQVGWFSGVHSNGARVSGRLARQYHPGVDDGGSEASRLLFKDMPDAEPDALLSTDSAQGQGRGDFTIPAAASVVLPVQSTKDQRLLRGHAEATRSTWHWAPTPKSRSRLRQNQGRRASVRADRSSARV